MVKELSAETSATLSAIGSLRDDIGSLQDVVSGMDARMSTMEEHIASYVSISSPQPPEDS
ncbi:hypothetical protein CXB51_029099 [Gossypium anomalum]|uniref:Uncharacterized protein n=1 Tax=Gossypium anomalum TaxID=47600 RepID=A0A8J6CQA2_9ROSI|nr:hypothetical protein CXB51_029099 [Gossypium anomalum]